MKSAGADGVRAAGAVVTRSTATGRELLLVHRKRYGDWSLPKGKLRPDETFPVAAVRETLEETGYRVRLGPPAGVTSYEVEGRPKRVEYWWAETVGPIGRRSGDEVDACEWFGLDAALEALQHENERKVAAAAATPIRTAPLVVARHAKARSRRNWPASDPDRPLAKRGNDQALRLGGLLSAWAPGRIVSSPALRCVDSIAPYAARVDHTVELEGLLSEEVHDQRPAEVVRLVGDVRDRVRRQLRDELIVGDGASPAPPGAVLCTHRPVLPTIAEALGIPIADAERDEALPTGGCWVVHLTVDGTAAIERHAV